MATLTEPTEAQLHDARAALLSVVLPYRWSGGEAPALWRTAHAALCAIEERLSLPYTLPPRPARRNGGKGGDDGE